MTVINPANFNERVDVPKGALINVHQSDGGRLAFDGVEFDPSGSGSVPDATTSVKGIVKLAADGGTDTGTAVQGNDSRLSGGGGGSTKISGSWTPADVTQDETATVLTIPANSVTLAFAVKRTTPTDAGSTPYITFTDGFSGNSGLSFLQHGALASDDNTYWKANGSSSLSQGMNVYDGVPNYYNVDTDLVVTYVAGMTPGAATPTLDFCVIVLEGVF